MIESTLIALLIFGPYIAIIWLYLNNRNLEIWKDYWYEMYKEMKEHSEDIVRGRDLIKEDEKG